MPTNKKPLVILVLLALIAITFLLPGGALPTALGQNFTLPTLTPVPSSTPVPSGGGGGGGGSSDPQPTSPPPPEATPEPTVTSTLIPVTIAPTPEGGFQPTAVPCSSNPTIQTRNRTNVRPGPGIDYEPPVAQLVFLEVRPILARAEFAPWWLIALDDGATGWVADEVVVVNGNTAGVPIANPAAIDGATPTPGAPWQPTPNPTCPTLTPTATATPSPEPSATHTPAPTETAVPTESATETPETEAAGPTPTLISGELSSANSSQPTETAVAADTATEAEAEAETENAGEETENTPEAEPVAIADSSAPANVPTAEPLAADAAAGSATTPILPIAAGVLILGGVAFALWRRFNPE